MEMKRQTKSCPFCGEEILSVAIKCKHCGSALEGGASPATSSVAPVPGNHPQYAVLAIGPLKLLPGVLWFLLGAVPGFATYALLHFSLLPESVGASISDVLGSTILVTLLCLVMAGVPAGLVFVAVMKRLRAGYGWPVAVPLAAVLAVAVGAELAWMSERGTNVVIFAITSALALTGASVVSNIGGRGTGSDGQSDTSHRPASATWVIVPGIVVVTGTWSVLDFFGMHILGGLRLGYGDLRTILLVGGGLALVLGTGAGLAVRAVYPRLRGSPRAALSAALGVIVYGAILGAVHEVATHHWEHNGQVLADDLGRFRAFSIVVSFLAAAIAIALGLRAARGGSRA